MNCKRCNDAGYIFGHWMPELCPDCDGEEAEPVVVHTPAADYDWILIGALIFGVLITIASMWGVIAFFVAVL